MRTLCACGADSLCLCRLKAKAQQDYERQQRENEELRKQIASGARKPTAAAQMLTPEQIAECVPSPL